MPNRTPRRKGPETVRPKRTPQAVTDLDPNPSNPRKAWETDEKRREFQRSLAEFGDLSGVVFNRRTGQLVGGHKRVEEFRGDEGCKLCITERLGKPDAAGTLAYGHVLLSSGVRFSYREVDWGPEKEAAANLAANKWGADWDLALVGDMLDSAAAGGFSVETLGFSADEVASLLSPPDAAGGKPPESFPSVDDDLPTQFRCPACHYEWSGKPK